MTDTNLSNGVDDYLDAVSGPHAIQRGQKGKLKVKSGMQKGTRKDSRGDDEEMLDVDEAREVARQIMASAGNVTKGSKSPKSPIQKSQGNARRTLSGDKVKQGDVQLNDVDKRRSRPGPGKRGVKFSSHPARRGQGRRS